MAPVTRDPDRRLERLRVYLCMLAGMHVEDRLRGKSYLSGVVQQKLLEAHQRYRRVCREMLERFRQDTQPNVVKRTAKTCCLAPGAVGDYDPVLLLAKRAVDGHEKHGKYCWFVLARGMVDYRMGNFTSAIDWVRRSLSPGSELPVRDGLAYLFLAMAYDRLLAWDRARTMEQRLPKPGADLANWPDWLRFHIVRREAEALIGQIAGPGP